jgi:hypothetical protein
VTTPTKKPYHKKRHPWRNQDLRSDDKRAALRPAPPPQIVTDADFAALKKDIRGRIPSVMVPKPRRPLVEKMCTTCPFNKDRGAPKLKISDDDFLEFKQQAIVGEFYCHETVLEDPRTVRDNNGDAVGVQPHFKVCRGAWELKLADIKRRTT